MNKLRFKAVPRTAKNGSDNKYLPAKISKIIDNIETRTIPNLNNPEKVFLLSQSWGVLSEKIFDEEGNYSINHSSSIILLKDGKYLDRISHHAQYEDIFKALEKHLR